MGFVPLPKLRDVRVPAPHAKAQTPLTENTPRRRRSDRDPSYRPLAQQSPTRKDIARRAYQLFEQRGGESGHDLDDWLQAERELMDIRATREKHRTE
jgi:hypothetical protein